MIKTKQPQVINARLREIDTVYIEAVNRTENDIEKTVSFDVNMYVLKNNIRTELQPVVVGQNDQGGDIVEFAEVEKAFPTLVRIATEKAKYKRDTFYALFPTLTPAQYDTALIGQIDFVNSRTWTGSELQQVYYWELTASDLEVLTAQDIEDLTTPYIL